MNSCLLIKIKIEPFIEPLKKILRHKIDVRVRK